MAPLSVSKRGSNLTETLNQRQEPAGLLVLHCLGRWYGGTVAAASTAGKQARRHAVQRCFQFLGTRRQDGRLRQKKTVDPSQVPLSIYIHSSVCTFAGGRGRGKGPPTPPSRMTTYLSRACKAGTYPLEFIGLPRIRRTKKPCTGCTARDCRTWANVPMFDPDVVHPPALLPPPVTMATLHRRFDL